MKILACIFDLDGVIVDTAKYHFLGWQRLARELGFEFSEEHNEKLKGVSRMRSLEILLDVGGIKKSNKEKAELAAKKNQWYVEYISKLDPKEILPGSKHFLEDIRNHGIKTALGSASKNAGLIIRRLKIENLFDVVIDGTKVSKAKPDPDVFLNAAQELDVPPENCVVFEDAVAGIEAAINGGMHSIGVGDPDILSKADLVIAGFQKMNYKWLVEWLNN